MAETLKDKARGLYTMNESAAAQMKELEAAESCPTCGSPMKAAPMPEEEMGPEEGGRHGMLAKLTGTEFPGYRQRRMKKGERLGGGY